MQKWRLAAAWVGATLPHPDRSLPDPRRPGVILSFKAIAGAGGRVLQVAHRQHANDIVGITAFFDRGAKR